MNPKEIMIVGLLWMTSVNIGLALLAGWPAALLGSLGQFGAAIFYLGAQLKLEGENE
jgi:hypothetical protein